MHLDVRELYDFYYRNPLGREVQKSLRAQLLRLWPQTQGDTFVGYGFAIPLLRPFMGNAARMTALMPGPQGVMHWPAGLPNRSVLCEETRWPVANVSVDRLILFHGLDTSEHPAAVLEECYRVLSDSGRAIVIVPNRASLWARKDGTPFAASRPYTATELERRLQRHGFTPQTHVTALYQPPFSTRFWRRMGPVWETIGRSIPAWKGGGVLMVEVSKQVPRPARPGLGQIISKPVAVWDGLAKPARV